MSPRRPRAARAVRGTIESIIPLRLAEGQRPEIEAHAKRAGLSMSEWIRKAIDRQLATERELERER